MADLMFDWFGFRSFAYVIKIISRFICLIESKQIKLEVSCPGIVPFTIE